MQLGLPKHGGHIQIDCLIWPVADAKCQTLSREMLDGSSQKSARIRSSHSRDNQVPVPRSTEVNI